MGAPAARPYPMIRNVARSFTVLTSSIVKPMPFDPPPPSADFHTPEPPVFDTPDPHLRPAKGDVVLQAAWDETRGLDLIRSWRSGERAASPNCSLLGLRFVDVGEGTVTATARIDDADGKRVAMATSGAMISGGRPMAQTSTTERPHPLRATRCS